MFDFFLQFFRAFLTTIEILGLTKFRIAKLHFRRKEKSLELAINFKFFLSETNALGLYLA